MNSWHEKKLIKGIIKGDEKSFAKVYDLYVDKIYKFVFLKINSRESAEEIVQDVFLKFWRFVISHEKPVESLAPLLYSIARNLIIDYYRANGKNSVEVDFDISLLDQEKDNYDIEKELDISYDMEKVKVAISLLPDQFQDIIILKFINGLDNHEIARVLNKQEGNIRVISHRALEALRKLLATTNQQKNGQTHQST